MSSITELNRRDKFDFVWQKDKTHPVSIESERSPSGMYLKQFENNISVIILSRGSLYPSIVSRIVHVFRPL